MLYVLFIIYMFSRKLKRQGFGKNLNFKSTKPMIPGPSKMYRTCFRNVGI